MVKEYVENETKEDRFKRLASARTRRVLDSLRVLSNCSNPHSYRYTEVEVNKIFRAIDEAVKESKAQFKTQLKKEFEL